MLGRCLSSCLVAGIACMAACLLYGCTKRPPAAPPAAASSPPAVTETATLVTDAPIAPPVEIAEPTNAEPPVTLESPVETAAAATPENEPSKERIVLLAPAHPLIVEFHLTIDGRPHTEALERLVEEVLQIADTDANGETTWKELSESKRVKYGQFGNLAIDNENSMKQVIDRYDLARDGVVGRQELPRFLTRNAGASRPFSVRGTLSYRNRNLTSAPTWQVIDADGDGRLSTEERATARVRLAARDADDDEIVIAADLSLRQAMPGMPMMAERRRGPDAVRLLGPHADWSTVQQSLEQEYGGGRFLRTGAFPAAPELFASLDKNQDGRLRKDEYPALNDLPPHLVFSVEFGGTAADGDSQTEETSKPRLKLVHHVSNSTDSSAGVIEQPGSIAVTLGGAVVTCFVNDTVAEGDYSAQVMQRLTMFDQNKDGYIEAEELPESLQPQLGRFEALDADENGKVYPQEIEAFLRQQQAAQRAQIHARAGDVEDTLFIALDADQDGRLTGYELEAAAERLDTLDQDRDGFVIPVEVPQVLEIAIARGSIETPDATFAKPAAQRQQDEKAPRWFTAMDANQDGVISRREFLGAAEHFAQLDKDANGLLSSAESQLP